MSKFVKSILIFKISNKIVHVYNKIINLLNFKKEIQAEKIAVATYNIISTPLFKIQSQRTITRGNTKWDQAHNLREQILLMSRLKQWVWKGTQANQEVTHNKRIVVDYSKKEHICQVTGADCYCQSQEEETKMQYIKDSKNTIT